MRKTLAILVLSISALAQTGQVNHGGTGLNTSANNSILVGTGPGTYTLVNVPDCQDVNGNHLNYTSGSYTINCGTSSGVTAGTPFQVTRYDSSGHAIQDSTGSDNPTNGPTRWTNGLSVENNAGYRSFSNSPAGTAVNLLACADASVNTVTQVTTCDVSSSKSFGIVDNGAGVTGNARVAMIGFHACVFDNQTAVNDYVSPSSTVAGQCSDVGGSKPNNVEILGKITTVNSGAGTLATVDLFTGDTIAPGSGGGSGTVSNSCTGVTYYPSPGTTVVGDCLFLTDGSGHITMYSLGLLDSTYAGFMYQKQGPLPPAAPANSIQEFAPTSVTTYSIQKASAAGTAGQCYQVIGTATDGNGHTIDQMGWGSCSGGGGGGSVTNFSSGNLSPLFTTSVANATSVPALTFALSNAAANTIFGNFTGSSGAPSYNSIGACGDSSHALSYIASSGFSCQLVGGASSVGLSINGGSSSGIFAITGSPVTTSGTLNTNTAGTSGGIPYFSSSTILSSSSSLNAHGVVVAGGTGTAPTSTSAGTSGQVLTSNGASADPTFQTTSAGNSSQTAYYDNDSGTGTVNFVPAKWKDYGINEIQITRTDATDANIGWRTNLVGVVQSGGGTSGKSLVAYAGRATCQFDNAATAGDFVEIGSTGLCTDNPGAGVNENPELHKFFAKVHTTIGSAGNTDIDLLPVGAFDAPSTPMQVPSMTPGSPFFSNSAYYYETINHVGLTIASNSSPVMTGPGQRFHWAANDYVDIFGGANPLDGYNNLMIDFSGVTPPNSHAFNPICFNGCSVGSGAVTYAASSYTSPYKEDNWGGGGAPGTYNLTDLSADNYYFIPIKNTAINLALLAPGHVTHWVVDNTGGFTWAWPTQYINAPLVGKEVVAATFINTDTTHAYCISGCLGPSKRVVATSQVAAISTTTMATTTAASTFRVTATLDCDSVSAAATVNITIGWTDPSNTAQTATLGSAAVCTTLGSASVGNLITAFRAKSGTNITYATSIVNTPTYDLAISLETLTYN